MRKCPKCGHRDPAAVKASRKYQRKVRRELRAARKAQRDDPLGIAEANPVFAAIVSAAKKVKP